MSNTIVDAPEMQDEIIDEFGYSITLRTVSKAFSADDEYGEATETLTDYSTTAMVQTLTEEDDEVKEGIFEKGTTVFFFKSSDSAKIVRGSRINYLNEWYEISSVTKSTVSGAEHRLSAYVKKI